MVRLFYRDSLWSLVVGPVIWAAHLIFCYIVVTIYCATFPEAAQFGTLRSIVLSATLLAFSVIVIAGVQAADNWRRALNAEWVDDADTLTMRRHFVGRAAFLLSGLSAIAVIYAGLPAIFISSCR